MPIEIREGSTSITGEKGMAFYRLAALVSALELQAVGLKMTRGISASTIARRDYGLKGSLPKLIEQATRLRDEASAQVTRVVAGAVEGEAV